MNLPTLSPVLEYEIIQSIINVVGRNVILTYVGSRGLCPVCGGTNPFCPTCNGNPTVDTTLTKTVLADIKWRGSDGKLYFPEGQSVDGDCVVNFMIDSAEMYTVTDTILKKLLHVEVDNRICVIKNWQFRGSPINRVYLVLKQDDDVGGQRIG